MLITAHPFRGRRQITDARPLDRRGYYRSPITMPEYRIGQEPANKGRKFPPEPLTPREALSLVEACGKGYAGARNKALITLLWRSGLRVAEALALYPKDVDLEEGRVHVLHGKGDKSRIVAIDPMAGAVIRDWLEARRELGATSKQRLFCVISKPTIGEPMHAAYVRNMVKDAAIKAGFDPDRRVHPHALRHTHAYELFSEGFRLDFIQGQLGHSSLSVTARYIEHLNPAERVDAIRGRRWPGVVAPSLAGVVAEPTPISTASAVGT